MASTSFASSFLRIISPNPTSPTPSDSTLSPVTSDHSTSRRSPPPDPRQSPPLSTNKLRKRGNSLAGFKGFFNRTNNDAAPHPNPAAADGQGSRSRSRSTGKGKREDPKETDEERWWTEEEHERVREDMDDLAGRVLFQSGTDADGHPLLVLCPCRLPSPSCLPRPRPYSALSNAPSSRSPTPTPSDPPTTLLFSRLVALFTNLTSSTPYTLVILASPLPTPDPSSPTATTMPFLPQIVSLYQSLACSSKRNAKAVVVVHPGSWIKLAMKMILLSDGSSSTGKAKVKAVTDLNSLGRYVPIEKMDLPHQVSVYDSTPSTHQPSYAPSPFGQPLELLTGPFLTHIPSPTSAPLPPLLASLISTIRKTGLLSDGIFRRSPLSSTLRALLQLLERGEPIDLESRYGPDAPYLAAGAVRSFLARSPRGLFGPRSVDVTRRCSVPVPTLTEAELSTLPEHEKAKGRGVDEGSVGWVKTRFVPAFLADLASAPPPTPTSPPPPLSPPTATNSPSQSPSLSPSLSPNPYGSPTPPVPPSPLPRSPSLSLQTLPSLGPAQSPPLHPHPHPHPSSSTAQPSTSTTTSNASSGAATLPYYHLLKHLVSLLHDIAKNHQRNRMDSRNLAVCVAPVVVRSGEVRLDAEMCRIGPPSASAASSAAGAKEGEEGGTGWTVTTVLQVLIERYEEVFDEEAVFAVEGGMVEGGTVEEAGRGAVEEDVGGAMGESKQGNGGDLRSEEEHGAGAVVGDEVGEQAKAVDDERVVPREPVVTDHHPATAEEVAHAAAVEEHVAKKEAAAEEGAQAGGAAMDEDTVPQHVVASEAGAAEAEPKMDEAVEGVEGVKGVKDVEGAGVGEASESREGQSKVEEQHLEPVQELPKPDHDSTGEASSSPEEAVEKATEVHQPREVAVGTGEPGGTSAVEDETGDEATVGDEPVATEAKAEPLLEAPPIGLVGDGRIGEEQEAASSVAAPATVEEPASSHPFGVAASSTPEAAPSSLEPTHADAAHGHPLTADEHLGGRVDPDVSDPTPKSEPARGSESPVGQRQDRLGDLDSSGLGTAEEGAGSKKEKSGDEKSGDGELIGPGAGPGASEAANGEGEAGSKARASGMVAPAEGLDASGQGQDLAGREAEKEQSILPQTQAAVAKGEEATGREQDTRVDTPSKST